ncbi:ABC transporter ATP-binding protein [Sporolactobacillus pectinivorans]|uniref:ABC transporter ATP-binding protein n=1 Tax=Sporolactobacillus pectinivorans TaxID=1591408 RepID=UPI000C25DF0C|nr:ABC transporter ATP-binding protein [Sporolactobacillus pectinivorans]
MDKENILTFNHVGKTYPDGEMPLNILKDITFSLKKGEFIGLVGPSGAGKSTLLSLAGALISPSTGDIILNGASISSMSAMEQTALRLKEVGFIFQNAHLVPYLTAREQLLFVARLLKEPKKSRIRRADELLDKLGLSSRFHYYPDKLSGGEKQRVAIARAMMNQPSLVLADEPTASLDYQRAKEVVEWLHQEVTNHEKGVLMVTHDTRMLDLCDRVIRLEDGHITAIS